MIGPSRLSQIETTESNSLAFPKTAKFDFGLVATAGLWVLLTYSVIRNILAAAARPFWFDELCTVAVAHQRNLRAVSSALLSAKDSSPLLYVSIEHFSARLFPNEHITYRLPSIAGIVCILWCLFVFIRKQQGAACAFLCTLFIVFTPLFNIYAIEARPYSLVVAFITIALVCYQRASKLSWMIFLGLSLTIAESLHYYAFFSFAPFAIAELALTAKTKKVRWGVWIAISSGFLPLIASWPLLAKLKEYYGADIWNKPSFFVVENAYGRFLKLSTIQLFPGLGISCAALLAVAAIAFGIFFESSNSDEDRERSFYEPFLAVGFLGLPFVAFVATKIGHGGLTGRYFLSMVLGIAIATSYVLRPLRQRGLVLFVLITFLLIGIGRQEWRFWEGAHERKASVHSQTETLDALLQSAGQPNLPVALSDGKAYVVLAYYFRGYNAKRLVGIVDFSSARKYLGQDSVDRQMLALTCCLPSLHIQEFRSFSTDNSTFLLYSGGGEDDWWPAKLRKDGYGLQVVASDGDKKVYRVDRGHVMQLDPAQSQQ